MALCADCNSRNASSVVFNITPRLPQHPGFKGKFIKPFYSLFRSPDRLDRVTTFKVSVSVFTRSTDVSRYGFDMATLTVGSMYPMESFGSIWRWLHGMGMSQVSASAVSCSTDICRLGFDVATLTDGSIDTVSTLWSVYKWLRSADAFQVSLSVFSHWFLIDMLDLDVYRFDLHPIASRPGSNDLNKTSRIVCR